MTCLEGYISQTVGPRDSVSETMLLYFGIRVECRWNYRSISFRWGCVLLESKGCSGRRNLRDTRLRVSGNVVAFRKTRRTTLEPSSYLISFRLCTLGPKTKFFQVPLKSEIIKSSKFEIGCLKQCCCISKNVSNAVRTIPLSHFVEAVYSWTEGHEIFLSPTPLENRQKMRVTKKSQLRPLC